MSRRRLALVPLLLALTVSVAAPAARAEIWWYIDEDGKSHVATQKLDVRYELFYKGDTEADAHAPATSPRADSATLAALRETPFYRRMVDHPNIKRYEALIDEIAQARGVDAALIKAVIAVESAFDPAAVSPKGALGLMQVIPDTGARYGVAADLKRTARQKLLDPEINVRIGTTYLRDLLALFANDVALALAAYNAGEQAVARYANSIPPYPETRQYVKLVQQFYELYRPAPVQAPPKEPLRIVVPTLRHPS